MVDNFWSYISGLAAILTIYFWARDILKENPKKIIYPLLIVLLTVYSTYQFEQNRQMEDIQKEAASLVASWPSQKDLNFVDNGEKLGIIFSGLAFLEKHKDKFPETYNQAKVLVEIRLHGFTPPKNMEEKYNEYNLMEDVAGAMIGLVSSISK